MGADDPPGTASDRQLDDLFVAQVAGVDHRQADAAQEFHLLLVERAVARQGVGAALVRPLEAVVRGRGQVAEDEVVKVAFAVNDADLLAPDLVQDDPEVLPPLQGVGSEEAQEAHELDLEADRTVDVEVPVPRVDLGPAGAVEVRDEVREVVGVEVGEDDVLDVVLAQAEPRQAGGDAASEVEDEAQVRHLDEDGRGRAFGFELTGAGAEEQEAFAHGGSLSRLLGALSEPGHPPALQGPLQLFASSNVYVHQAAQGRRDEEICMHASIRLLRYTIRQLVKNPGSSAVAVVTMALGISLTVSMFSIIDGVLLKGLPFEEGEEIVAVWGTNPERDIQRTGISHHDLVELREQQTSFEGLAGTTGGTFNLSDEGLPDRYNGGWVSANAFDLLGVKPLIGSGFEPAHEQPGAERALLLGYHVWQQRYGGDADILGRVVRVNSEPATIVGVMPEGFQFPGEDEVWLPLVLEVHERPRGVDSPMVTVFGRLKDGGTIDGAASDLATIARRLAEEYPETHQGNSITVEPFVSSFLGEETILLLGVMMSAVVLVLLVACFNVTNLLLGRAFARSRELAIRSALGARRWRTVGLILTESALIAASGAVLGMGLAHFAVRALNDAIVVTDPPFWFDIALSGRVLLFTTAVTALSALAAGFVPALQASRSDVSQVLQDTVRGTTSWRIGWISRSLVVAEVAISCALLVAAGLMVRSVLAIQSYDLKFDSSNLLTARVGLFEGDYPEESEWLTFFERVQERVGARPEVEVAAIGTVVPVETEIGSPRTRFERLGESYEAPFQMPLARLTAVSPGYFETIGVAILAGRDFTAADREGSAAVAIVNQDFASKEWPGKNPIGQRVNLWRGEEKEAEDPGWVEVVGLVPDLRFADFDNDDDQEGIYVPLTYQPPRFAWIIVRTHTDPLQLTDTLRRTVLELDPNLPLYFVNSMEQVLHRTM